ncbi:hypothetical protein [Nostoc sp.]|uniref:hypothetical protein n=1 Tax=Nostoc sp. TaxID=1180 RepID=UPI002FF7F6F6
MVASTRALMICKLIPAKRHLVKPLGFLSDLDLETAATLSGLNSKQYLEELSGWQSRTVIEEGEPEIRFFPPTA